MQNIENLEILKERVIQDIEYYCSCIKEIERKLMMSEDLLLLIHEVQQEKKNYLDLLKKLKKYSPGNRSIKIS